jgi:hypothetical protein
VKERVDGMLATNSTLSGTQLAEKIEDERHEVQAEKQQQKMDKGESPGKIEKKKKKWKTELPDTLPEYDTVRAYIRTVLRERKKATGRGTDES